MIVTLQMHVRELPEGRVVVTPIDFPRYTTDADSYEAAVAALMPRLDSALRDAGRGGSLRSDLAVPESAELDEVEIPLPKRIAGSGKPSITVSLVVTLRPTSRGELFVVKVPEIPDVAVAVTEREHAIEAARKAITDEIEHWDLRYVLSCDLVGEARLESVDLKLPAAPPAERGVDDEGFSVVEAGEDLCALAAAGRLEHFDERPAVVHELIHALASPGPSSVILVGPANVGKTALIHEVARLAASDQPTEENPIRGRSLLRISANELIAGARYTGMWQDRARSLVEYGRTDRAIIAMGDPMSIIDAGRWSKSDNNLSRVLRPFMENGDLTLICECTPEVYAATVKLEPSFAEAFTRIDVPEPDASLAARIVDAASARIAARESIHVEPGAIAGAIELTSRFQPFLAQPGKSVRLLEATARRHARAAKPGALDRQAVVEEFARSTGLPLLVLSDDVRFDRDEARAFFEERVLGQDDAVDAMVDLISVVKAGLSDPGKPLGVFFCIGPTGVGKTELTKTLAEYLFGSRDRIIRYDMGEYASSDAVVRLVGDRWNNTEEGDLTRRIREEPFSVVLFDELEKANRRVFDVLLSVLGEGRLTDAGGRAADFRNSIIVMTSNLGAEKTQSPVFGFADEADAKGEADRLRAHFTDEAQKFFRPEFFNRIDRVIAFRPLDRQTIQRIARRELGRLLDRQGIVSRRLLVEIDDAVVDAMAEAGFDPKYGARPLHRQIERRVIQPLARVIVEQRPGAGDLIRLVMDGESVDVALRKVEVAPPPRRAAEKHDEHVGGATGPTLRLVESLHDAVCGGETVELAETLRDERSSLVERTNQPSFWDDSERAKQTLSRLYQIERAVERLDRLVNRTTGLVELARNVERNRDRGGQVELRHAVAEVEDEFAIVRLELAGAAAGPDNGAAKLRVVPVAGANDWADMLVEMYVRWAVRSGREAELVGERTARIAGLSSFDLLRSEQGLHKHSGATEERLARVIVSVDGGEGSDAEHASGSTDQIVRVFSEGRLQFVRDPRTGVKVGDVASVLRGGIDDFLVSEATRA